MRIRNLIIFPRSESEESFFLFTMEKLTRSENEEGKGGERRLHILLR